MCLELAQNTRSNRGHLVSLSMLPAPLSFELPLVPNPEPLALLFGGDAIVGWFSVFGVNDYSIYTSMTQY